MGRDKANLRVSAAQNRSLLLQTAQLVVDFTDGPVFVVGRDKPEDWSESLSMTQFLPDELTDAGPIAGLQTALRHANGVPLLVVACDMPALTLDVLKWLSEQEQGNYGTVTQNGEQWEPLFSIYTVACLRLIDANLGRGKRSLHALISAGGEGFSVASVPPEIAPALVNVNTPEEWATWLQVRESQG